MKFLFVGCCSTEQQPTKGNAENREIAILNFNAETPQLAAKRFTAEKFKNIKKEKTQ